MTQANRTQASKNPASKSHTRKNHTSKTQATRLAGIALLTLLSACGSSSDTANTANVAANAAATPRSAETTPTSSLTQQAVTQINAIRATARNCGGISFAATSPVAGNGKLEAAAGLQAQYMQTINTLTHLGSGNSGIGDRITSAGYVWNAAGENVAVGHETLADVLQGWVESPGHCANLMSPGFADVGIAQSAGGTDSYWALTLAKPAN